MNTSMDTSAYECERTLLVQADFDGELDAGQAAALVTHLGECAHCQRVQQQLVRTRELLRAAPRHAVPAALREAIWEKVRREGARVDGARPDETQLGEQSEAGVRNGTRNEVRPAQSEAALGVAAGSSERSARTRAESAGAELARSELTRSESGRSESVAPMRGGRRARRMAPFGWGIGVAIAASVLAAVVLLLPRSPDVGSELVNNHLRAMQLESHLIDVASSDHHTVKPWFAGKVDFAPPVKELDSDGYVLKGGRVDVVGGRAAAVLVYQAGRHVVDVYMWPAEGGVAGLSRSGRREGFNLRQWREGDLAVWCVSDMGGPELDRFVQRWRARE